MAAPNPSKSFRYFAGFTTHPARLREVEEELRCIRCKQVPNPKYFMTCRLCDRITCGGCAFSVDIDKLDPEDMEKCCSCGNLVKGSERFLKLLLQNCYWDCEYKASHGCTQRIAGSDWKNHVENCPANRDFLSCYSQKCQYRSQEMKEIVAHLIAAHNCGTKFPPPSGGNVNVCVHFKESVALRGKHYRQYTWLKLYEGDYLFVGDFTEGVLRMWIWDVQSNEECNPAKFILKLKTADWEGELQYSGRCHSYNVPPERIFEEGKCPTLTIAELERQQYVRRSSADYRQINVEVSVIRSKMF